MVLFEDDDGFKSIHVLFSSFVLVIVYFCWKSTQVSEQLGVHHLPIGNFGNENAICQFEWRN